MESRSIERHLEWSMENNNWTAQSKFTVTSGFERTEMGFPIKKKIHTSVQNYVSGIKDRSPQDDHNEVKIVNNCRCNACVEVFNDFCGQTSLHGLKFVGNTESHLLERLFWAITFFIALLAAAYYIEQVYSKWMETPVIVSIGAKTTPMNEIPFPAVTICTMNEARKSNAEQLINSKKEEDALNKRLLTQYCNDKNYTSNTTKNDTNIGNWNELREYMTRVRQPCHEMILHCKYGGEDYPCNDIFNPTLSDEGICCAFNKVKRDFMYRNPRELSDMNLTYPFPAVDWTPENGYPGGSTNDSLPWRPRGSGSHLGLTIVLNTEDQEFYCSTSASKGFKMLLHNPVEAPKIADYGSMISGGREYRIRIKPTIMNSSNSLRTTKEIDRQCVFSSDIKLLYYRTYSQRNCILECESRYTLDMCNCVPYYLPKNAQTPVCGRDSEDCTIKAKQILEMMMVDNSMSIEGNWSEPECYCLPACSELSYSTTMTYGMLEPDFAARLSYLPKGFNTSQSKRNLAVVHIFFTETQFQNYYKSELIGISDFLSSTGGLLGLFLGFSFVSAVEVIYFATVRLGIKLFSARKSTNILNTYHKKGVIPFIK